MSLQEDVGAGQDEVTSSAAGDAPSLVFVSRWSGLLRPLKYLFGVIRRLLTWATSSAQVEEVRAADTSLFPGRRWVSVKKRLSILARFMLTVVPCRIRGRLGLPVASSLGQGKISDELRKSPNKPNGKGSKRKQDDLAEEDLCWIETLSGDLSDDDDLASDPNYEPTQYYTESDFSEEHRESNDTETDLEVEHFEWPPFVCLKEAPHQQENEEVATSPDSETQVSSEEAEK
ncbi:oogenesis-related [Rhinoraja longicauda]